MARRALSAALLCLVAACHAAPDATGGRAEAIVDGTPDSGDPAVVAIAPRPTACGGLPTDVVCTGTLVAPRVVLTAAHCLERAAPRGSLEVFFGGSVASPDRSILVADALAHPEHDDATNENDLALLLLAEEADATPVALPTASVDDLAAGAALRAVGFGVTGRRANDSGTKREGSLALGEVRPGSFDATADPGMTCVGDSGGPVFATVDGAEQLVGVTSRGDFACADLAFQVRVDAALDGFVRPFLEDAATAPPGWPTDTIALAELGDTECTRDLDCPALLACDEDAARCVLPGTGPAEIGDACASDAECGDGFCARLWPAGEDACRCATTSTGPSVPDPPGDDDDSGCTVAAAPGPSAPPLWAALCLAALGAAARRRR